MSTKYQKTNIMCNTCHTSMVIGEPCPNLKCLKHTGSAPKWSFKVRSGHKTIHSIWDKVKQEFRIYKGNKK
jgi:hypothetical protein